MQVQEQIQIIEQIKNNPSIVANAVGFKDVKPYPHNEWMKEILFGQGDYTLMAHRGSFKSSCLSVCIALLMVLMPWINILFLRKADNDVDEMVRMVKKALESEFFQALSIVLWGKPLIITKSNASSITTNLYASASGATQLLGIGLKASITGKHADIVITDDICNINDRISRTERERTKLQYQELQNIKNRGGRIINTGTKWHAEDVFTMMENIHIYDYHKTGLIDDEKLKKLKASMLPSLFACNYELKIIASEDVIFENPKIGGNPYLVEQGTGHIDAAYGGYDKTAFTLGNKHDGKLYVLGKLWDKPVDECQSLIKEFMTTFNGGKIWCETNADKGYLKKKLKEDGLRAVSYHEGMNKFIKITTYLKGAWDDIIFVDGTDDAYIQMILDFNENVDHDDAPDSLASLVRILYGKKDSKDRYISELYDGGFKEC